MPAPMPQMTQAERRGRILLAAGIGVLFLAVVASLVAGEVVWPAVALAVVIAGVGGGLFLAGRR